MRALPFIEYFPLLSGVAFLVGLISLCFFQRWAWGLIMLSSLVSACVAFIGYGWIAVASDSINISVAVYGFLRWSSLPNQTRPTINSNSTLDDFQHIASEDAPQKLRLRTILDRDLLVSAAIFCIVTAIFWSFFYFLGVYLNRLERLMPLFFLSANAVALYWLAERIYQTWWLFLGIFTLRIIHLLSINQLHDFKMQALLIAVCIASALLWQKEWRLQNKANRV